MTATLHKYVVTMYTNNLCIMLAAIHAHESLNDIILVRCRTSWGKPERIQVAHGARRAVHI